MKIVKTASGKQTIKISKKDWASIGKKAGWMKTAYDKYDAWDEEARRRGRDPDDAYDMMRDYGGNIDEARRDREQNEKSDIDPVKQELYDTLDNMWKDKSLPDYKDLKGRIDSGDFKNKFHLINSVKKRLTNPSKPKSKFEPERERYKKGPWIYERNKPLPPEIEAEAVQQRKEMTQAILNELPSANAYSDQEYINVNPWANKDAWQPVEFKRIVMKGVEEGKWDEYLAKKYLDKLKDDFDAYIR